MKYVYSIRLLQADLDLNTINVNVFVPIWEHELITVFFALFR
jgi:hypothetical protein